MVTAASEYSPALLGNMQKQVRLCIPEIKEPEKVFVRLNTEDDNKAKHSIQAAWHVITFNLYSEAGNSIEEKLNESHIFFERVALDAIALKGDKAAVAAVEGMDYCINEAIRSGMMLKQSWRRYERIAERAIKQSLINASSMALKSMYAAAERFQLTTDRDFSESYTVLKRKYENTLGKF